MSLKQDLEASIRKFFEFYDEFSQNKSKLASDVFDHFQEIRFKIDEHRERLKEKIDEFALAMIDEIKKHEVLLSKNIKEKFSLLNESQSLGNKLNEIEDTFRDPNLKIESIREMQQIQEESISVIQFQFFQAKFTFIQSKRRDAFVWLNQFKSIFTSKFFELSNLKRRTSNV
jgi:anion-transporting  ArsA/GET3 family ATPase